MEKTVAYSILTVKAVDDEQRVIRGIATTPEADRVGDIVEPLGVKFKNPTPLLWMHNHSLPVGSVTFGKPTAKGVPFEAKLPVVNEPSQLKARIDEAWQSVKTGLVRAVSIGFRPLEYLIIEETGGLRFTKSEIMELSLVSVPANSSATIDFVKSLDRETRAALGKSDSLPLKSSGVTEKNQTVKLTPKEGKNMSISDKLKGFRDELAIKNAKLVELANKSVDEGATFDAADQEAFDTLEAETKSLKEHISRMEVAENAAIASAKPVAEASGHSEKAAVQSRSGLILPAQVKAHKQLDKGIAFAQIARAKAISAFDKVPVLDVAKNMYGEDSNVFGTIKAAVAVGTTTGVTWAKPLVGQEGDAYADFLEFLRPSTIIGRIPGLNNVPFRTRLISQTSGGVANWVGEAAPKPVTAFDFAGTTLEPNKVAAISVLSMELVRDSSPAADAIVRNALVAAVTERLDIDFLDPTKTLVSGVSPASISNGVTPIASSGTDADAVRCDLARLIAQHVQANSSLASAVLVMSASLAVNLMTLRNAFGQREFPDLTIGGGSIDGIPVITSEYVARFADSAGEYVFLINARDVYIGDEGGVTVDATDTASVQMDSAPTNPPVASTVLISLWQHNLMGFRAERTISWKKARTTAVSVLSGVNWSSCA